jgi:hypothetical protein
MGHSESFDLFEYSYSFTMSDSEDGHSDIEFDNFGRYDDSEGDLDEIAQVLDDHQGRASEDPDEELSTDSNEDDDTPQLPQQDGLGTSSKQPRVENAELAGISPLIVPLLQAGYSAWRAEKGNKRKKVWKDILRDFISKLAFWTFAPHRRDSL